MTKVLVTGAAGQLGRELCRQLKQAGYEVIALTKAMMNISDQRSVRHSFSHYKPDIVVNTAAYTSVDQCETELDKAYLINGIGAYYTVLEAEQIGARVIHISTDYVFSGRGTEPYKEDDPPEPGTIYGKSKKLGEELIRLTGKNHTIVRTSWVYGSGGHNFVNTMLKLADTRDQVRVVSDQIGSPTYTKDLAETVIQLFDSPPGTYHAANAGICSWYEFAKAIMEESGRKTAVLPVSTEEYGNLTPRPAYSVLSLESIEKLGLGMRHWRDALRDYLQGEGQCK
ncbi:dTDP-4-dehydrorhamnose reductase [Bacillus nakamurai]|uniref:dTDP-4-dehydrorhamnose reductase n=1 Tax=Bacillus nakamurai TaxID=1793963 RepID=A0A150F4I2_9BACI|nr:dTDP-4-dehydrorhamnose reductase [Bacillus nakamurai]KXZ16988.1 NAD(P)-dependent oxidoreductase [Bacillus nakamurai]MED1229069.1 dTDP-4-dehydrorhamnose reductase [Bacillus nakamurai]